MSLTLTVGIPGAGKSYWVNEQLQKNPTTKVVSTDELRKELTGVAQCDPRQNDYIHNEARKRVKELLQKGYNVIVDSTNVDREEWDAYKALCPSFFIAKVFDTSVEQAMANQENRERKVPEFVVQAKYDALQANKQYLTSTFNLVIF